MELKAGWAGFQPGLGWVLIQIVLQVHGQGEQGKNKPWGKGAGFLPGDGAALSK